MVTKKLPVGIDSFEKLRASECYYLDKTGFIKELLNDMFEVNLITRPRRFGKTLNMSMLKSFFEIGADKTLFDGLEISQEKNLCEKYMGQYPVISITLKSVEGQSYEEAVALLRNTVNREALRLQFLIDSEKLSEYDKAPFIKLLSNEMDGADLKSSLLLLSRLLCKHFGKKAILLVDEYDVPLDKAYDYGYYDKMISLLRSFLEHALKTNEFLQFAVLTGCLRVSKESIFTGLNNFSVNTIADTAYEEYFGFTDAEVKRLLHDYSLERCYDTIKEWYDGYRIGKKDVYCPWDVINYVRDLLRDPFAAPKLYWINTSSNGIVKRFIHKANKSTQREIEQLIDGETITKVVKEELTYNEIDKSIENLWSVLYTAGYLTQRCADGAKLELAIPNREITEIFIEQIQEWFQEQIVEKNPGKVQEFCNALKFGDVSKAEEIFNEYLRKTVSIRDMYVHKARKENFYYGILLGLLGSMEEWVIRSNMESGEGYADILVEIDNEKTGFVIEIKYAEQGAFEAACKSAMLQIDDLNYAAELKDAEMETIYAYGVACYKKSSRIQCRKIL